MKASLITPEEKPPNESSLLIGLLLQYMKRLIPLYCSDVISAISGLSELINLQMNGS